MLHFLLVRRLLWFSCLVFLSPDDVDENSWQRNLLIDKTGDWRNQEGTSVSPRHGRPSGDSTLPTEHSNVTGQAFLPAACERNLLRLHARYSFPACCHWSSAASRGSLPGRPVRRYQLVRHPCQPLNNHGEGYDAGSSTSEREGLMVRNAGSCKRTSWFISEYFIYFKCVFFPLE
ncbi:hypothetical protein RvY_17767-2 [Ramazzottius varieornatus]|uniref:Secreted protein n=1 Tax=Ramazzottius varieornatus TaxID=947166 RepID=A0A1D1W399_RAMVA|nr:hypothetical protein RvY_17767-2 [Ramazzottius varieornatus]